MDRLKSNSKKAFSFVALIALALVVSAISTQILAQAGFSGSIQTSDSTGTVVNQNLFTNKTDVYLNGGPQNANASGLPNGTYYFQVTDPSGANLLSSDDAVCRQLVVVNGRIAGASPASGGCAHASGTPNPLNGTTGVQLAPFNDTPNNGGLYKVWLIRQNSNTSIDPNNAKRLIFRSNDAKTDNFKIKTNNPEPPQDVTYTLSGCKFYDANVNGIWDNGEATVGGVRIRVTYGEVEVNTTTGEDGCWEVEGVPANAEYTVEEEVPLTGMEPSYYWLQTAPGTPSDEFRGYTGVANGPFTCDEENPEVCVGLVEDLDFGNVCFGPAAGGYTLGFWSNKNGEKRMGGNGNPNVYPTVVDNPAFLEDSGLQGNLNFLKRLNLKGEVLVKKQAVTQDFDPANYPSFKTWLLNGNAYNMSYMLSVQLAATSLNVRLGSLSDSQIVDASNVCDSEGYCLGIINIGNVRVLANESLGAAGGNVTISGSEHRESQNLMKNFLDAVNNNKLSFAQDSACTVFYPSEEELGE